MLRKPYIRPSFYIRTTKELNIYGNMKHGSLTNSAEVTNPWASGHKDKYQSVTNLL